MDPDSQQTRTAVSAPLTAAMLNGLCSDRRDSVASFLCFHTKTSQNLNYSVMPPSRKYTTSCRQSSHIYTNTSCGTDFVNADMETWSTTMRKDHKLRLFKGRVLRKILPPKRNEVTGEWSRLLSHIFHDLYPSSNMKSRITWTEHVACSIS